MSRCKHRQRGFEPQVAHTAPGGHGCLGPRMARLIDLRMAFNRGCISTRTISWFARCGISTASSSRSIFFALTTNRVCHAASFKCVIVVRCWGASHSVWEARKGRSSSGQPLVQLSAHGSLRGRAQSRRVKSDSSGY